MVYSRAASVGDYIAGLPADRRPVVEALRSIVLDNLPPGYEESMQFGMIGYCVPLARYPKTYNGAPLCYVALASQKRHLSLYLMGCYGDEKLAGWFEKEFAKSGKKLDMGKSCIRFRSLDDLPLGLVARTIAKMPVEEFIALYERSRSTGRRR